jgi:hypothetical protein
MKERIAAITRWTMGDAGVRMTDGAREPDKRSLSAWLGAVPHGRWMRLMDFIDTNYPGVFKPDWIFGGKKHGWGLRFKKSKSFCTLIPERKRFLVLIVFGKEERARAEEMKANLGPVARRAYDEATIYHDGKWVVLPVERDKMLTDICRFLAVKRRPANHNIAISTR